MTDFLLAFENLQPLDGNEEEEDIISILGKLEPLPDGGQEEGGRTIEDSQTQMLDLVYSVCSAEGALCSGIPGIIVSDYFFITETAFSYIY